MKLWTLTLSLVLLRYAVTKRSRFYDETDIIQQMLSGFASVIRNLNFLSGSSNRRRCRTGFYLIYPVLIYCNVVRGGCCKTYLAPLQVIQRKILRIMSFKNIYDHTSPLFLDFNALTVDRINIYVSIIHVFKCLQNRSNDVFQRYIPLQYQTRLAGANSLIEPAWHQVWAFEAVCALERESFLE